MCGILFSNNPAHSRDKFLRSLGLMEHRGPDVSGCYWSSDYAQLGHNRLSILDLDSRSNQPFVSADSRYVATYNGEIYNYRVLAKKYQIPTKTTSDTEILVELFSRCGPSVLSELNGMFAIVIFDTQTNEVFLARDRLGIKPLYLFRQGEHITVASEMAALLHLVGDVSFDPFALRQYRKLRSFFNGRTAYKQIELFPAGHYQYNGHRRAYWTLPCEPQIPPSIEELEELLVDAVSLRCISDVTVGSYLSGGLDSTLIAGLANKPDTWTVGFPQHNEFKWSRLAADAYKSSHREVLIDEDEFSHIAQDMIQFRREPLSVPNEVLLYKMTQRVKDRNTVVLSGEGADELFFGYDRIFRWAATSVWDIQEFTQLYAYGTNEDYEVVEDALGPFMKLNGALNRVAAFFQISHLHGLLRRLDNSTMRCSVEARVPFVDHRLIERLAGVSFEYRMANGVVKSPLKEVFKGLVPKAIIERKKVGFPVPLDKLSWSQGIHGATPMDRWLEFNLRVLTGGAWECEL